MKKFLFQLIPVFLLLACNGQNMKEKLNAVDSLVESEQYDSAYVAVLKLSKSEIRTDEDLAHYYLLLNQTRILTRHADTLLMLDSLVIPYYSKMENYEKNAEAYYYKAYGRVILGEYSEATLLYKKAEEQACHTNNLRLQYKIAESLSTINEIVGNYHLQLNFAKKSLDIAQRAHNDEWIAYAYCRISLAHSRLNRFDSATLVMKKAIPYTRYIKDEDLPTYLTNAAYVFKYSLPDTAKRFLTEALTKEENAVTLQHLADIHYNEGNKEEAYRLWIKALALNDGTPKDNLLHNILDYNIEHHNIDHICETVNEIIHIKDSMLNSLRNDTIKDLQLRFDHEVAMHKQELKTNQLTIILQTICIVVLFLVAYILVSRLVYKIRMQTVQMEINDYMSQIRELKSSDNVSEEEIARLNKKIKDLMDDKAPDLKLGRIYYDDIVEGKVKSLSQAGWKKREQQLLINYYAAIDYRTVNRLKNAKRKDKLTTHRLFYLLLVEMGKSEDTISTILGLDKKGINTIKSRTKIIE